jgi:4-amino-4-deoxy-L-arabinose transferase-like glycosyltransferase
MISTAAAESMPVSAPVGADGLTLRDGAIIAVAGAAILGIGLGRQVMTFHEVLYSEPAREMLASHSWIISTFMGVPMVEKPPAIQWAVALAMAVFGSRAEWVTRLPALIAAILTALLIAHIAARFISRRAGLIAGLVQLSVFYVQSQGRRAEPDMLLCAAVTAAMAAFIWGVIDQRENSGGGPGLLFYLAAGLSFLPKGPIGPALIFPPCLLYAITWHRLPACDFGGASARDRRAMNLFLNPAGLLIFAVLVLAWPVAACIAYPPSLGLVIREHTLRLGETAAHQALPNWAVPKPWYFYLPAIAWVALPWTPAVLIGLFKIGRGLWTTTIWRFLTLWLVAGTILLSIPPSKHWHYIIPVVPPLSVIVAVGIDELIWSKWPRGRWYYTGLSTLTAICGAGAIAVMLALRSRLPASGAISVLVAIATFGLLSALYLQRRQRAAIAAAALFAVVWIASIGANLVVVPKFQTYLPETEMARRIDAAYTGNQPIFLMDLHPSQIVWYLSMPLVEVRDVHELAAAAKPSASGTILVLARHSAGGELRRLGSVTVADSCVTRHDPAQSLALFRIKP